MCCGVKGTMACNGCRPIIFHFALLFFRSQPCRAASSPELKAKLAELERRFEANRARLDTLEASKHRRLISVSESSIYGEDTGIGYSRDGSFEGAMTNAWLILCGALVMFLQAGFAMLEAGVCRKKSVESALLKSVVDVSVSTLAWWAFGWSLAYTLSNAQRVGDSGILADNGLLGTYEEFFGMGFLKRRPDGQIEPSNKMANWFFQWAFACMAAAIVRGSVAERAKFPGYMVYSLAFAGFIYPAVVAWTWGKGWLTNLNSAGYTDFAGSGVVHLTGGIGALVGAIVAGPRRGRFKAGRLNFEPALEPGEANHFAPHCLPLVVAGTFILWFGWYGLICGSTRSMNGIEDGFRAAHAAMNTTISAAASGLTAFLLRCFLKKTPDVGSFCSGVLAGLVSITGACSNVGSGSAFCIGLVGALLYQGASSLLDLLKVDDPLDAFPVHGACGAWGVVAAALFDFGKGFDQVHGWQGFRCMQNVDGTCRTNGLGGQLLAANLAEVGAIALWVGVTSAIIFLPLRCCRQLMAPPEDECDNVPKDAPCAVENPPESRHDAEDSGQQDECDDVPKDAPRAVENPPESRHDAEDSGQQHQVVEVGTANDASPNDGAVP